jgi:hypothetical protein
MLLVTYYEDDKVLSVYRLVAAESSAENPPDVSTESARGLPDLS